MSRERGKGCNVGIFSYVVKIVSAISVALPCLKKWWSRRTLLHTISILSWAAFWSFWSFSHLVCPLVVLLFVLGFPLLWLSVLPCHVPPLSSHPCLPCAFSLSALSVSLSVHFPVCRPYSADLLLWNLPVPLLFLSVFLSGVSLFKSTQPVALITWRFSCFIIFTAPTCNCLRRVSSVFKLPITFSRWWNLHLQSFWNLHCRIFRKKTFDFHTVEATQQQCS